MPAVPDAKEQPRTLLKPEHIIEEQEVDMGQQPPPEETALPNPDTPKTRDPALAAFVDRNAVSGRVTSDITSRIPRVQDEEDITAVVSVLLDTEDGDTVRNEAANLLRRSGYKGLADDLIKVLNNPQEGPRFRSFCIQHLWQSSKTTDLIEIKKVTTTFHNALEDQHVEVRREALLALVRMEDSKGKETAIKWLLDEGADNVRDLAIRCVHKLDLKEYIPTVRKYLHSEDEVIRIAAIVALSQWGDEESRPSFEEAAKSGSFRVQRAGKAALKRIQHQGGEAAATEPEMY